MKKVNPKGGAIALGHPLGCTGARQIATLLPELKRTNGRYGVISMCIGTGMGAAGIIELEWKSFNRFILYIHEQLSKHYIKNFFSFVKNQYL